MPYIKQADREAMDSGGEPPVTPGELNYAITMLVKQWLNIHPTYERYNAAIGVLECAKLELYRRRVAPYEDGKIRENGDVY